MKKIFILAIILVSTKGFSKDQERNDVKLLATPTYTYVQVNKIRGGLFGYKTVKTKDDTNGNKITNCVDPGTHKCKAEYFVIDGNTWTNEQVDALDRFVTGQLTSENTSGVVLYGEQFVVSYIYNVELNALSYNVYTVQAAQEAGIW